MGGKSPCWLADALYTWGLPGYAVVLLLCTALPLLLLVVLLELADRSLRNHIRERYFGSDQSFPSEGGILSDECPGTGVTQLGQTNVRQLHAARVCHPPTNTRTIALLVALYHFWTPHGSYSTTTFCTDRELPRRYRYQSRSLIRIS